MDNSKILPFCPLPTYLGVKLDRVLTYCCHLEALGKKLFTCILLLRRRVGSRWGTGAKTLCTAHLPMIYSNAEYCAPAWCCSMHTHLIDSVLNDTLHIVTGYIHPTDNLPVLLGIQPTELCHQRATLSLANCSSLNPGHVLHGQLTEPQAASKERLKSRHPFAPTVQKLLHNLSELGLCIA